MVSTVNPDGPGHETNAVPDISFACLDETRAVLDVSYACLDGGLTPASRFVRVFETELGAFPGMSRSKFS